MARVILPHAPGALFNTAILAQGEAVIDETTNRLLVGDGQTPGGVDPFDGVDEALASARPYLGKFGNETTARTALTAAVASVNPGDSIGIRVPANIGSSPVSLKGQLLAGAPVYWNAGDGLGRQVMNLWGRDKSMHFGREYLYRFLYMLEAGFSTIKIALIGDSNTEGYAGPLLAALLSKIPGAVVQNFAVSGTYEQEWYECTNSFSPGQPNASKNYNAVLAFNPDLLINGYGFTNDPYFNRTVDQAIAAKRAFLTAWRNAGVGSIGYSSIVQMSANAQRDGAANRDEFALYEYNSRMRAICDEAPFWCAWFDKNAVMPNAAVDSAASALPYKHIDAAGVHTVFSHARILAQEAYEFIVPSAYRGNGNSMYGDATAGIAINTPPNAYPVGYSMSRVTTSDFKVGGWAVTFNPFSGAGSFPFQLNYDFGGSGTVFYFRRATNSTTWGPWSAVGGTDLVLATPASGFTQPTNTEKMQFNRTGGAVFGRGYIEMTTPALLTAGQAIATVPTTHVPTIQKWWCNLLVFNGTTWEKVRGILTPAGALTAGAASTINAGRIYIDDSWIGAT